MQQPACQSVEIASPSDVNEARRAARSMAMAVGFDDKATEEIVIVASELASNLVKHARGGRLTLAPLAEPAGMKIESLDNEGSIPEVERALADGYSTAGSLGYGLGAVNRLMDSLDIQPRWGARSATRIVCRRLVRAETRSSVLCPLAFGVATRPHPGMPANGDAFVVKRWGERALVGVIDGLGHGQFAHRAAETARQYVESHVDQPLDALFRGASRACIATRGVVMALARFDWARARLTFASVGNVEVRVFGSPEPISFMIRRGIVGLNAPNPVVTEHPWKPSNVMVLHSDGLSTRWRREDFPDLWSQPAAAIAQQLLKARAKDQDDATVVVVRDVLP